MKILVVDDEVAIAEFIKIIVEEAGHSAVMVTSADKALNEIRNHDFDVVVSDIHMPRKSGIEMMEEVTHFKKTIPPFLFVSGNADPHMIEKASAFGAVDILQKPIEVNELLASIERLQSRSSDKIADIMEMIRGISGISLGKEKRALVETRLLRRARHFGFGSLDEYYNYFTANREAEVRELVSLITTHTTQFFRESGHFDYLFDHVFPGVLSSGRKEIKIWSAASSTGEEAYSLALAWLEFLRGKDVAPNSAPKLKIFGTDIDHNVVDFARKGIFPRQAVEKLAPGLQKRYFDFGSGDLANFVKVKDFVHQACQFSQLNLIGTIYPDEVFDIVFLRNVLIYFKPETVQQIVSSVSARMAEGGHLFLGHSESLTGMTLPLQSCGNAVYKKESSTQKVRIGENPASPKAMRPDQRRIRVFIMDDSATIRTMLHRILDGYQRFMVVGEAESPRDLKRPVSAKDVDVMTLDIHMPGQDGIEYLRSIQGSDHPPVVMLSSVSQEDGINFMKCLDLGAVDYLEKPDALNIMDISAKICESLLGAVKSQKRGPFGTGRKVSAPTQAVPLYAGTPDGRDLILIGASTGGVEAIKVVLEAFPSKCPPILIVQHIPEKFSRTFAERLNQTCPMKVVEAKDGDIVEPGTAYVAPGGLQMGLSVSQGRLKIQVANDPPVNRHRPSVDYLFTSVKPLVGKWRVSAALLTGMGADGADGLLALKRVGVHTVAQDEESSVVYGMPKAAAEIGGATEIVPLQSVAYHLFKPFSKRASAA